VFLTAQLFFNFFEHGVGCDVVLYFLKFVFHGGFYAQPVRHI